MVLPREARRGEASVTDTHMFIHSFIHAHTRTVVDSWTSSYAAPFNATKFEVEFGGTVVATTSASPASPIDRAAGTAHEYVPSVFEVTSLLESAAIPDMIASGQLPPVVPDLQSLTDAAHAGKTVDGATMEGVVEAGTTTLGGEQQSGSRGGGGGNDGGDAATATKTTTTTTTTGGGGAYNATEALGELMREKEVVVLAHRSDGSGVIDRVPVGKYALVKRDVRRSGGWKVCKYQQAGYFSRGSCTTYSVLDSLCVKVTQSASGEWSADDTFGGIGCSPKQMWLPPKTRRMHAPLNGQLPKLSTVRMLGAGFVTVRSGRDPLIAAMNITHGSMFFAESEAEASATGTILLIVGIALLVPGIMLSTPYVKRFVRGAVVFQRARALKRDKVDPDVFDDIL